MYLNMEFQWPAPPLQGSCCTTSTSQSAWKYKISKIWPKPYLLIKKSRARDELTLLLVAEVAEVLAVSRRKTVCFFLYSSIVRNFSFNTIQQVSWANLFGQKLAWIIRRMASTLWEREPSFSLFSHENDLFFQWKKTLSDEKVIRKMSSPCEDVLYA